MPQPKKFVQVRLSKMTTQGSRIKTCQTCWLSFKAGLEPGAIIDLIGVDGLWRVEWIGEHSLSEIPATDWQVGGLSGRRKGV